MLPNGRHCCGTVRRLSGEAGMVIGILGAAASLEAAVFVPESVRTARN